VDGETQSSVGHRANSRFLLTVSAAFFPKCCHRRIGASAEVAILNKPAAKVKQNLIFPQGSVSSRLKANVVTVSASTGGHFFFSFLAFQAMTKILRQLA
jgi:hypothetical protein